MAFGDMDKDRIKRNALKMQSMGASSQEIESYLQAETQKTQIEPIKQQTPQIDPVGQQVQQRIEARPGYAERMTPEQTFNVISEFEQAKKQQPFIGKVVGDIPILGRLADTPQMAEARRSLPLGSPALGALSASEQYIESIPAEIGTSIQKGTDIVKGIGKALSGQSTAEIGDIMAGAGAPEIASKVVGFTAGLGVPGVVDIAKGLEKSAVKGVKYLQSPQKLADDVVNQAKKLSKSIGIRKVKRFGKVSEIAQFEKDIANSAEDIFKNSQDLVYKDLDGNIVGQGRTPQNMVEQAQAIEQRRSQVFNEYDNYVKQATGKGITIDPNSIREELTKTLSQADIKKAGGQSDLLRNAQRIDNALSNLGELSPVQAQSLISDYGKLATQNYLNKNFALSDFYTNLGKKVRGLIDDSIEQAGLKSEEYFKLRDKYRMYKNIEKDVNANIWKEYNAKGALGSLADAFSFGDVARGLVDVASGNLASGAGNIAKGLVQRLGRQALKTLQGSDYNLNQLYKKIGKYQAKLPISPDEIISPYTGVKPMQKAIGQAEQGKLPYNPEVPEFSQQIASEQAQRQLPSFKPQAERGTAPVNVLPEGYTIKPTEQGGAIPMSGRTFSEVQQQIGLPQEKGLPYYPRQEVPINVRPEGYTIDIAKPNTPQGGTISELPKPKASEINLQKRLDKLPESDRPLYEEALKYDNVEEFIKGQGKEIYHGTDKIFDNFDVKQTPDGSIWFTDSKESITQGESGASGTSRIINMFINENKLKLADWDAYENFSLDQLQEMGYDGVKLPDDGKVDYQIFFPEKLQTKAQLSDIYNKAQEMKKPKASIINAKKIADKTKGTK